ncbi:hypothetical protein LCGC14_2383030, partial [marine sediment metagenome]
PMDGRMQFTVGSDKDPTDLRVSFLPTHLGQSITARILLRVIAKLVAPDLASLPYSPEDKEKILRQLDKAYGLVVANGPAGCGKTTTLYALINHVNSPDVKIMTIEDPIEFFHEHKKSTINQREVGVDVPSFAEAIRRALRQDPDVILVGELRDLETIEAAITAAETGHIVFGTLHTNGAQGTINRIIDVFPTSQQEQIRTQLSEAVIGILAQQLLPRIGGGRVAAYEMLIVLPAIKNLIRENKTYRITSSIQTGQKYGMQLLDDHLFQLWKDGVVEEKEALYKANEQDSLAARIVAEKQGLFEAAEDAENRLAKEKGNTKVKAKAPAKAKRGH